MMSTGSLPLAGLPHHGGQNFENTDTFPCCYHDQHDQKHPGDYRDALNSARWSSAGKMVWQTPLDASAQGRSEEASRLWQQMLSLAPDQPEALQFMAQQAMRRGDGAGAFALLQRAGFAAI